MPSHHRRRACASLVLAVSLAGSPACGYRRPTLPQTETQQAIRRAEDAKRIADASTAVSTVLVELQKAEISVYDIYTSQLTLEVDRLKKAEAEQPDPAERATAATARRSNEAGVEKWRTAHGQVQAAILAYVSKTRAGLTTLRAAVAAGEDTKAARDALVAGAESELPAALALIPDARARAVLDAIAKGISIALRLM